MYISDFLAQVNDDENTEGDTSNTDMIWYIVGAAVAATLVGTGCLGKKLCFSALITFIKDIMFC